MPKAAGIIGKKLGMTRVYDENGHSVPVTVIEAGPCRVLQVKSQVKEGYDAVQLGFSERKLTRVSKAEAGHCKQAGLETGFYEIKEFAPKSDLPLEVGQVLTVDALFKIGDKVTITGKSKGRGFQGVVRRHGFKGGRATHGSNFHRAPGSIGSSAWPSRVLKGQRLPGRMGNASVTQKNLRIVDIREDNILLVRGAVPGAKNAFVSIYAMSA